MGGYPPKIVVALAAKQAGFTVTPAEFAGSARTKIWLPQLEALGFPVLPKGKRPARGQDCRGIDMTDGKESAPHTTARPLPHLAAYRAVTDEYLRAAAQGMADTANPLQADPYSIWIDGQAYPFWRLFRAAVEVVGGRARQRRRPLRGHQPEHNRVRALGFEVLPTGISPVAPTTAGTAESGPPSPNVVTVAALQRAAVLLEQAPEFRDRREDAKYELWVDGHGPYPIKAMCLLAFHCLGYGWHESWTKGGANSPMERHSQPPRCRDCVKGRNPRCRRRPCAIARRRPGANRAEQGWPHHPRAVG